MLGAHCLAGNLICWDEMDLELPQLLRTRKIQHEIMSAYDDLPKAYDASSVEDAIYEMWERSGAFQPQGDGKPFCVMMPPPNVTGVLHLGHAFEDAIMDTIVRFQRLRGRKTLLVPGTDHAAIATQAKVEKILMAEGMQNPRKELSREQLHEKIRIFAETSKSTILSQIRKVGTSCDWTRLAYTFDDARSRTVNELFIRMHADGLIYRGYRVVNWSVKGQSTCSDDEIVYVERQSKLYTFKYSKDFPITIATTRPETKLGDTAVAVHPADKRFSAFIGKTFTIDIGARKPLEIKIIADEEVDPSFGTGALGVTPAHSAVDFAMYERQKAVGDPIDIIPVIGTDGRMTEEAGIAYVGLSVEEAREKFVGWLRSQGLLEKEEDIMQNVGTSDRYGDVIEAIPLTQWWLDVNKEIPGRGKNLRDFMREAVTTGLDGDSVKKVTITPDRFTKLYLDRVEHLHDWCLSRQILWGHRIPAWYHETKNVFKDDHEGEKVLCQAIIISIEKPICKHCGAEYIQDPDTLDTWFSSGSWPFSTLGWPLTRVLFVRHGQAHSNLEGFIDDRIDNPKNPLTDTGRDQIVEVAEHLVKEGAVRIIASPVLRTKQTAEILAEKLKIPLLFDDRLREIGLGKYDGGSEEVFGVARGSTKEWISGKTVDTIESYKNLKTRADGFMDDLLKRYAGKTIIVVSHGDVISTMGAYGTDESWLASYPKNGGYLLRTYGNDGRVNTDLQTFFPTTWMQMGYEILYLWLMRMILMSTYALDDIPFGDAYIHGILRDKEGKKFSKSSGNGIDPIKVIDQYGCDALRVSLLLGVSPGNDSRYYTEKTESGRNFVNKLWNISRFILSIIPTEGAGSSQGDLLADVRSGIETKSLADQWIMVRIDVVIASVTKKLEGYEFSSASEELRDFTWGDLADWYLEIAKIEQGKEVILRSILQTILKLWHPFMPFVTEHIWKIAGFDGQLIIAEWPNVVAKSSYSVAFGMPEDTEDMTLRSFDILRLLITDLRRLRAENGVESTKQILFAIVAPDDIQKLLEENMEIVKTLARASSVKFVGSIVDDWATTVSGATTVGLDLSGAIDIKKEKAKLSKEIAETEEYIVTTGLKMKNVEFMTKAPTRVKETMEKKYGEANMKLQALKERLTKLE